ncbi:MAG: CHRD domain-containing protein [Acidimicrobiales bacterium]
MKRMLAAVFAIALIGLVPTTGAAEVKDFEVLVDVEMDGGQEVPPVVTGMTGRARLKVEPHRLRYQLWTFDSEHEIFATHIHCGPPGENGPVGISLFSGSFTKANGLFASGNVFEPAPGNGCGWGDLGDVALAIQTGQAYVNVHTTAESGGVPAGEIRGDLGAKDFEVSVDAEMTGGQEVPAVVTGMTGLVRMKVEPHRLQYRLWTFDSEHEIFAAHIHCGPPEANGPVGVTLFSGSFTKANGLFAKGNVFEPAPGNGCGWSDLADVATAIQSGGAYVNVHTTADSGGVPSGEVRANLAGDDAAAVLAKALAAIGGADAVSGVDRLAISATGETSIDYEAETPDQLAPTGTYQRDYTFDFGDFKTRVDVERQLLFEGFRFLPPQSFTIVLHGNVGGISAGAAILGPDGGNLPSQSVAALSRQQTLFNPHSFLVQALFQPTTIGDGGTVEIGGVSHHVLRVADSVSEVRLFVNTESGLIAKLETTENNSLVRDTMVEVGYDGWADRGGVSFPDTVELRAGGRLLWQEMRSSVELEPSLPAGHFDLPDEADSPTFDPATAAFGEQSHHLVEGFSALGLVYDPQPGLAPAAEIAPGIALLGSSHNSLAVRHDGGVVAIEAPISPEHGSAVVDGIGQWAPDEPISHIVVSHHHVDHAAGVRSVVAAGATAVVAGGVDEFWANVLAAPSTIRPDPLAGSGVTPVVEVVDAGPKVLVDDPGLTVTAYHLADVVHSDDTLITLIETDDQMIVYEADLYNAGFGFTVVVGGPESFFEGLRTIGIIDGDCNSALPLTIVPAHGFVQTLAESLAELDGLGVDVGCGSANG